MVTTRASKRRRKSHENPPEEAEQEQPPQSEESDGDIKKSAGISPVVVLAHGAGAPSSSDWMVRWKAMLAEKLNAVEVITFDYPYIAGGKRRAPPKAEKLVAFHCDIVRKAMAKYPGHPLVLAGKSMGSRISCMVAEEEDVSASAVICLGYPLKGGNGAVRDATLLQLNVPVMFVQGSKVGLCPLEKLEAVRKKMKSATALHVIEGGDHSFKVSKKQLKSSGSNQEESEQQAVEAIAAFVSQHLKERSLPFSRTVSCDGPAQYENSSYLMLHNIPTNSCHDHGKHSLSKKVKEMAHSAGKLFHPHDHKPTCNKCGGAKKKKKTETNKKKKKVVKNTEGHWSHWMPNMLDHLKIKNSEVKNIESGSDSDCECESNITRKKN